MTVHVLSETPRYVLQHRRLSHLSVMIAMVTLTLSEASLLQPGVSPGAAVVPLGYLTVVLCAGIAGWYMAERHGRVVFSARTSVVLVLIMVVFIGVEYLLSASGDWVVALSHFLILVQLVRLFGRKRRRDYSQMYLSSLIHICVASVVTADVVFAVGLLLYSVTMTWTLVLFHFRCHLETGIERHQRENGGTGEAGLPVVLSRRFITTVFLVLVGFWVGNAIFFVFSPRLKRPLFNFAHSALARTSLSGFGDTVGLGALGRILQNDSPAMHVTMTRDGRSYRDPNESELEWRGMTLQHYDGQTWRESGDGFNPGRSRRRYRLPKRIAEPLPDDLIIKQSVLLQPIGQSVLFALTRPIMIEGPRLGDCEYSSLDWTLRAEGAPVQPVLYEVQSVRAGPSLEAGSILKAFHTLEAGHRRAYMQLPDRLSDRVRTYARDVTVRFVGSGAKARAISGHLRDNFTYTLELDADPNVEPIEYFLFTRKKGHCEYFASAMVVMLRSVDIPARMVTGFKGGPWNDIGEWYLVRQSDAHAWVEAWIAGEGWVSFDPTPPGARTRALGAHVFTWFARWKDYLYNRWMLNVFQYDRQQQTEVYRRAGRLTARLRRLVTDFGVWLNGLGRRFRDAIFDPVFLTSAFGIITLVVTLIASAILGIVIYLAGRWGLRALILRRRRGRHSSLGSAWFYVEMLKMLRRQGLRRRPETTPNEFARLAVERLGPESVAPVTSITDVFCRIRYGGRTLSDPDHRGLREQLDQLRDVLGSHRH